MTAESSVPGAVGEHPCPICPEKRPHAHDEDGRIEAWTGRWVHLPEEAKEGLDVGERPNPNRDWLEGYEEGIKRGHATHAGGAVGEREELDVERLARALTRAGPFGRWLPSGSLDNPSDIDAARDIAAEYARLSVNEGGAPKHTFAPYAPYSDWCSLCDRRRHDPIHEGPGVAPVARTEAEPHE